MDTQAHTHTYTCNYTCVTVSNLMAPVTMFPNKKAALLSLLRLEQSYDMLPPLRSLRPRCVSQRIARGTTLVCLVIERWHALNIFESFSPLPRIVGFQCRAKCNRSLPEANHFRRPLKDVGKRILIRICPAYVDTLRTKERRVSIGMVFECLSLRPS